MEINADMNTASHENVDPTGEPSAYHLSLMFLKNVLENLGDLPASREVSLAKTKTEEAMMWLEKADLQ